MNAAYFTAAIPEPFQILGLKLKPLSLGRYRIMKRFNIGFVSDEPAAPALQDLIFGVLICSQRCDEFWKWFESPRFLKDVRKWGKKVSREKFDGVFPIKGKGWNVAQKFTLFQRYIEDAQKSPQYWPTRDGDDAPAGAHWAQTLEVVLRGELGWTDEEINEQPLSKAISDYFAYAESQGALRLATPEEIAQGEANEKILRAVLGQNKEGN